MNRMRPAVFNPPAEKPLLVFDADCSFCRRWVARLQTWVGDRLSYRPFQEAHADYPEIPLEDFQQAVQYIGTDGTVSSGAEAIFRALAHAPTWRGWLWLYEYLPGFAWISEWFYGLVARNRNFFDRLMTWTFGRSDEPATYLLSRWVFLRVLAVVYLMAFLSFWVQMEGLIGSRGILPASEYLARIETRLGWERFYYVPTLFWLNSTDGMFHMVCAGGVVGSVLLFVGMAPLPVLAWLWFAYSSVCSVGQAFMQYQWDVLLMETGFLAIFLAPAGWRPRLADQSPPPRFIHFLFWWLLFRVMFSSGFVKLASGDPTWHNLTALSFHYETQPIPNWFSWYVHQLPIWFHSLSAAMMFFIELAAPLLIFTPRLPRLLAVSALIFLQALILLTGNYGFFNWLTIALCLLLVDDVVWKAILPARLRARLPDLHHRTHESVWKRGPAYAAGLLVLLASWVQFSGTAFAGHGAPAPLVVLDDWASPFNIASHYGLFAVMTVERPEIILEGSRDGTEWKPYVFHWKPGPLDRAPQFVSPHMPRLDWQMWFAALGHYQRNTWLLYFMERLLQGSPEVLSLMKENPFPDEPPRYLRAELYLYHFTRVGDPAAKDQWWTREYLGPYCPTISLPEDGQRV